ncbi:hypothetical protein MNBD_GAMMA12-3176 [hydrothermal vent metagenome]|uniref:HicB-like antitoxin of toxin-antitoxin system domain-containing protein n=1 Tax=hydrothermal vent metagenome TaxID=652676 RepID=A0A3B0YMG1_9ZZZZ
MKNDPHTYAITVQKIQEDGIDYFESTIKEFPDIAVYGETYNEAYELAIDAIETSFQLLEECGIDIPNPIAKDDRYSGRVTLRMMKSLHAISSENAESEGVSLNSYITSVLAEKVGVSKVMTVISDKMNFMLRELTTKASQTSSVMLINFPIQQPVISSSTQDTYLLGNQL